MAQIIFDIFKYLADVPLNIWPWLLLVSAPLLIFSAKPHHSAQWRLWRIIVAVIIGYVLINLTLHTHRELGWKAKEACESSSVHRQDSMEMFEECGHHVNIADGASYVFYLVLGWVPAAAYAGFWEFWWRRKYAFIIRPLGKRYKGKWFSTALILCSVPVWIFIVFLLALIIAKFVSRLVA
jgi:hypothetical protein